MWIRKSEKEISELRQKKELEKKSLTRPAIFAAVLTAIFVMLYYFGFRGRVGGFIMFSTNSPKLWMMLFLGVFVFTLLFLIAMSQQRKGIKLLGDSAMLCQNCKEPSPVNIENLCQCGGTLEHFEFFEWQEESVMQESKI
jgi:hypothetical protein